MKKLIALMLTLCLCAACFAAFAEDKEEEEKPAEKTEETADEKSDEDADEENPLDDIQFDSELLENIRLFQTYDMIYRIFDKLDIKDNEAFKTVEKAMKPVDALGEYFMKNGDKVTDIEELKKVDELKEFSDFFDGKTELNPEFVINNLLALVSLDDNDFNSLTELGFGNAILKFAVGFELLKDEIEETGTVKFFKSILDYARGIDNEYVKGMLDTIQNFIQDILNDAESRKIFVEELKLLSEASEEKVKSFEKDIKASIDLLADELKSLADAASDSGEDAAEDADKDADKGASDTDDAAPEEDEEADKKAD